MTEYLIPRVSFWVAPALVVARANQANALMNSPPTRLTRVSSNDQLLYFTSTSITADGNGIVVISDRTGNPNLFFLDVKTGRDWQITHNREGVLKSYVYFDGTPYKGFGKASVSLDPYHSTAYYIQGRELRAAHIEGNERVVAELPEAQMTAFTHISADGTRLCVPTTDARALEGYATKLDGSGAYNIDDRVQVEGLSSYLRVFDTSTGAEIETIPVPRAWVTHVQFSPADPKAILYNHEWPSFDCGVRRMWLWDGQTHHSLRKESPDGHVLRRSRRDWTCHEMWERDGNYIIYHGTYDQGPSYIGRVRSDGSDVIEIPLPVEFCQYGHFTVGCDSQLVTDGYYRTPETPKGGCGKWIALLDVRWEEGKIFWKPLTLHGSSWASQDAHPHPIIDHDCKFVYYTSDIEGKRAVYRLPLDIA